MAELAVKMDPVAALRRGMIRKTPDPIAATVLAELAGANGIVAHIREERRLIQERDVRLLRQTVKSCFILEMAPVTEMVGFALDVKPDRVTLVPSTAKIKSAEGGFDLVVQRGPAFDAVATLQDAGIPVGILIDPDPDQVKLAHKSGAIRVQIHTGILHEARTDPQREKALSSIGNAVKLAGKLRLGVAIGRGIAIRNLKHLRGIGQIHEVVIGHSIAAQALLVGMDRAVRDAAELVHGL